MVISRFDRQSRQLRLERHGLFSRATRKRKTLIKWLLIALAIFAILPPLYFHFKLRRFNQMRMRRCSWLKTPPLVCAHGGDSSKAFPNTVAAYHLALNSEVDCIELDVSRSSDGMLFALHDRQGSSANIREWYISSWAFQSQRD
ncbi:hypothetical protein Leryth_004465 [Lithospermum erythrorhizon]|nr:hypothetical protein Leryth_004465 [Lithospermum erythrorhizon]